MPLQAALEALKRNDFAAARDLIAREDTASFGLQHFLIKGLAEMALEDWMAAEATFSAATGRFPDFALFWLNRGVAAENMGQIDASISCQERCLMLNPKQSEAYGNLSNLYRKKNRFAESEEMARHALANGASKADALNCLGLALNKQGKFREADTALRQAQQEAPGNPEIIANRANLAVDALRFDEAWKLFAAARAIKDLPVFRQDEGLARLLSGDYGRGLALFETRLEMPGALRIQPPCPRWNGESLKGKKLLIIAEQGFGDVIQFCRYQKFLTDGKLAWVVPRSLVRLLSDTLRGEVLGESQPLPACDYYVPILSLPLATGHLKPAEMGAYLTAPQKPVLPQAARNLKIGLVWAGSRTHGHDFERSLKLEQIEPLLHSVDAQFYAPFVGDALGEIENYPITRLDSLISDFADTAALLMQMDYLVTVDTSVAHLAGALGVKTFLLLAHSPDWRWGTTGETTKWYPSMTLLRQPKYGDWQSVVEKLIDLLKSSF